jgi:NAD(P)-dependent dehydrogenase (short-subunit alcohol dehydrogenase family)
MDLFDLSGRRAFIPGGYGGIGSAIAEGLCRAGASVVVAGRSPGKAAALAGSLAHEGFRAHGIAMDASSTADIARAADEAAAWLGGLDILVNCVGDNAEQPLLEVTEEAFDEGYRTNLRSAMFLAQAAARHQVAAGRGGKQVHLLTLRSILGARGFGYSAYCAAKGGLLMLVKQHALELAAHRILVNGIAPTVVETGMSANWREDPERWAAIQARIPLGRVAQPSDLVGAAIFLCSAASDFVTGQVLFVDGGVTASQ